jgi:succinylglutamate desuccinylase
VDPLHPENVPSTLLEDLQRRPMADDPGPVGTLADLPRVLGRVGAATSGPTLICVGGLHGNEPAGVRALERVFARLEGKGEHLQGQLVGLAGNRRALAIGKRFIDKDLNRIWTPERLEAQGAPGRPDVEDLEMWEMQLEFERSLAEASGRVYLLDIHSTSGAGGAFAVLDDTLPNREFALSFPVPIVLGLEEELIGTMANHLSSLGVTSLGFEAGQHDDPASIDRAELAIWLALEASGILPANGNRVVAEARQKLGREHAHLPEVVEVRHRHELHPGDRFRMHPGYQNFQPIDAGVELAADRYGPIETPQAGMILLPLYQQQGEDGYFVVKPVRRGWLEISSQMRRFRVERFVHWIPGVAPHPELAGGFVVDRRVARWGALEIFHLLGFRRHGPADRYLTLYRRDHAIVNGD